MSVGREHVTEKGYRNKSKRKRIKKKGLPKKEFEFILRNCFRNITWSYFPIIKLSICSFKYICCSNQTISFSDVVLPFYFYLGFFSRLFTSRRTVGKREAISLIPLRHFHRLHRHLGISRAITAESSPLHIVSSRTWTGNLWFLSASL